MGTDQERTAFIEKNSKKIFFLRDNEEKKLVLILSEASSN